MLLLPHNVRHRLAADVLDSGERVAEHRILLAVGDLLHHEGDVGSINVGRQKRDAEAVELLSEKRELVGVAEVEIIEAAMNSTG